MGNDCDGSGCKYLGDKMKKQLNVFRIEQGHSGHFIGANDCLFKRCTYLSNGYIVSTIGQYFPKGTNSMEQVGLARMFETMVFRANEEPDSCGCYRPSDWSELDMIPSNSPIEAQNIHEMTVLDWMNEGHE
jgi:hypothetical protein